MLTREHEVSTRVVTFGSAGFTQETQGFQSVRVPADMAVHVFRKLRPG